MESIRSKRRLLAVAAACICALLLACAFAPQPAHAKTIDATKGRVTFTGKVIKRYMTTDETQMGWSAVVYYLKFSEPVKIKFDFDGTATTKTFKRIQVATAEHYSGNDGLYKLKISKWEKRLGKKTKVKGKVFNTMNAHTHGWALLLNPKIVKMTSTKTKSKKATNTAARKAYMKKMKKWKASSERDADGICFSYAFMDIDGDGIDEALCIYYPYRYSSGQRFHIADYVGGKVKVLCTYRGYGPQWVKFYRNGRGFVFWGASHANEWYYYYKLSGGKYKYVAYRMRTSEAGGGGMNGPWSYYVGKSETSKAKFNAVVSGIAKGKCKKFSYKKWKSL